jgi:hypothetical protein
MLYARQQAKLNGFADVSADGNYVTMRGDLM